MLKPFLIILTTLIGVCTILWGFPGIWAWLALVPAFILGATIGYFRGPPGQEQPRRIRPGVLVLGGFFGLAASMATVLVMWAAVAPEEITVEASVHTEAQPGLVWRTLGDPLTRPRWHTWMTDVEVTGRGGPPAVGQRYRSELQVERQPVYARHEIIDYDPDRRFTWTLVPQGGGPLEDLVESITLAPEGGGTRIKYALTYKVRSVLGRVGERLVVRRSLEKVAKRSLELLAGIAEE